MRQHAGKFKRLTPYAPSIPATSNETSLANGVRQSKRYQNALKTAAQSQALKTRIARQAAYYRLGRLA